MQNSETVDHLFLRCSFASQLFVWLESKLGCNINQSNALSLLAIISPNTSAQLNNVRIVAVNYVIWIIWTTRNNSLFSNQATSFQTVCSLFTTNVKLSGNLSSNSMQHSMSEFTSLKAFAIDCHPPKASSIHQVNWHSLILGWIKCNTDRATRWCPSRAGCGGIFRNLRLYIVGGFVESLGIKNSIFAKLMELLKLLRLPILKTRRNHGLNMTLSLLSMR